MFLKTYDGSGNITGRISLDQITRFEVSTAGPNWVIRAYLNSSPTTYVPVSEETFADRAAALAGVDDLLVNGS